MTSHSEEQRTKEQGNDDTAGLLHALEVLRQQWSHNINFEATLSACIEEIELTIKRAKS